MAIKILHGHANAGPGGKRSYIAFGGKHKTRADAKKYARQNLLGGPFKYVPSSQVKRTKADKHLFYIQ